MFCTNCGQENKDGAKFCTSCGAPLGPVPQGPVQGQGAPGESTEPTPVEQPIEPERPRRRIGAGAVAAIVLAVLLVLGGGTAGALYLLKVGPFAEGVPEAQDEPGEPEGAAGEDEPEASAGDEKGDEGDEKSDEGDKGDKGDKGDEDAAGPAGTDAGIDSQGGRAGTVEVPGVVGMSQSEALQALSEAGLVSRIGGEEHSSKVAELEGCRGGRLRAERRGGVRGCERLDGNPYALAWARDGDGASLRVCPALPHVERGQGLLRGAWWPPRHDLERRGV